MHRPRCAAGVLYAFCCCALLVTSISRAASPTYSLMDVGDLGVGATYPNAINDLGQLNSADGIEPRPSVTYRETRPGRLFRSYAITLNQNGSISVGQPCEMPCTLFLSRRGNRRK